MVLCCGFCLWALKGIFWTHIWILGGKERGRGIVSCEWVWFYSSGADSVPGVPHGMDVPHLHGPSAWWKHLSGLFLSRWVTREVHVFGGVCACSVYVREEPGFCCEETMGLLANIVGLVSGWFWLLLIFVELNRMGLYISFFVIAHSRTTRGRHLANSVRTCSKLNVHNTVGPTQLNYTWGEVELFSWWLPRHNFSSQNL